jgi:Tol biopolymer transport system component
MAPASAHAGAARRAPSRRRLSALALGVAALAPGAIAGAQEDAGALAPPLVLADSTPQGHGLSLPTTRTIRFTTHEGTWLSVDVAPDGRTIVFDLLGDLYALPLGGSTARRLTSGPAVDRQPRFSPDGRHLLFLSDRRGYDDLWLADADGGHPHPISPPDPAPLEEHRFASAAWLRDGAHVIVAERSIVTGATPAERDTCGDLQTPSVKGLSFIIAARRSPDRRTIAVSAYDDKPPGGYALFTASANGRLSRQELPTSRSPIQDVWWRKDGREIWFSRRNADGRTSLFAMPSGGGGKIRELLRSPDAIGRFSFDSAQRRAACIRENATTPPDIALMDLRTGELRTLTNLNPELRNIGLSRVEPG